nr:hypothetical protein Iba_chr04dCG0300 [Ipomoea batatas]
MQWRNTDHGHGCNAIQGAAIICGKLQQHPSWLSAKPGLHITTRMSVFKQHSFLVMNECYAGAPMLRSDKHAYSGDIPMSARNNPTSKTGNESMAQLYNRSLWSCRQSSVEDKPQMPYLQLYEDVTKLESKNAGHSSH